LLSYRPVPLLLILRARHDCRTYALATQAVTNFTIMSTDPSAPPAISPAAAAAAGAVAPSGSAAASLEITPDDALTFSVRGTGSKCVMTLRNPDEEGHVAFKVKTTQPRRYLVRPNQGLIPPQKSEEVTILLVDKDRAALLRDFDQIGPPALEGCKDKFLVQCCHAPLKFVSDHASKIGREAGEALTAMWGASGAGGRTVSNKKLQVRHVAGEGGTAATPSVGVAADRVKVEIGSAPVASPENISAMSSDQILTEVTQLRKKYDELVAFSVNLTAERDILNNTLEQTKRDLNREQAARMSDERSGESSARRYISKGVKSGSNTSKKFGLLHLGIAAVLFFFVGRMMGPRSQECVLPVQTSTVEEIVTEEL